MMKRSDLIDAPERRGVPANRFEIRADDDRNVWTLTGYATVFNAPYDVYGGPPTGWTEIIDRKALDRTLAEKPDLHLLINHEGMPLARTKSGTLRLSVDDHGLKVDADLDPADPDAQRLRAKMNRGDMDEMSFAFRVKAQEWNDDETERRITEVSLHKGDVSVVNFGANPATSAQVRSLVEALAGGDSEVLQEVRGIAASDVRKAAAKLAEAAGRKEPIHVNEHINVKIDAMADTVRQGRTIGMRKGMTLAEARSVLDARDLNGTD